MDLSSLNDRQQQAVTAPLGPVLVLAGPGSGKTKTLTHRIAYIIEQKLVRSENILALTFTNKAAKEMRERVSVLLARYKSAADPFGKLRVAPSESRGESLTMGTFHSVCARLLRKEIPALGYGSDFVIFDTEDQRKVLREICDELRLDKKLPPSLFAALISRAKNLLQTPAELDLGLDNPFAEKLQEVYARYQDSLYKQNALDFDDLLMLMVKILQGSDKVLRKYQKQFSYILVDEYQDTNLAQYALLQLLGEYHQLFVVGDDAQSIYGFRGSDIRNILNFEKDFPECQIIKLEQNYRSSQNILAAAQKVIELNSEQKPKTLWTKNSSGEKVILYGAEDERAEAEFVAKQIIRLSAVEARRGVPSSDELEYETDDSQAEPKPFSILDRFIKARKMQGQYSTLGQSLLPQLPSKHDSLKEFCVLYRTHAQSRALEEVFIQAAIPYQIVGGLKFYERKEIKDVLAYLRLLLNFRDFVSLKRVINEPPRGIGDKSYLTIRDFILDFNQRNVNGAASENRKIGKSDSDIRLSDFRIALADVQLPPKQWQSAQDFFATLEDLSELPKTATLPQLMKAITRRSAYEKFLRDGSEQGESRWENVEELWTVAAKFGNLPWREGAQALLEEVALLSEIDSKDEHQDSVTLMTLHSAKGLEFDNVFFVGLEEGILPHSRSLLDPKELAEEVRLAYVGLTRARKRLFLVYAQHRRIFGNVQAGRPSRILRVLPKENLQLLGAAKEIYLNDAVDGGITVEEMEY